MAYITRTRVAAKAIPTKPLVVRRPQPIVANNAATRAAKAKVARAEIDRFLKLIAEAEYAIDEAVARNNLAYAQIEAIMREHNIEEHSNGVHIALIEQVFSRQTRTIDPKKFKAAVASEDFWKAITVSITEASKILTEKELNTVSDVTPGKSQGFLFKCKRVERKTRQK